MSYLNWTAYSDDLGSSLKLVVSSVTFFGHLAHWVIGKMVWLNGR
jgi:hypothetical protein